MSWIQIGQSKPIRKVAERTFMVSTTSPSSHHHSLIHPGPSERLGFGVSQYYNYSPSLSDRALRNALSSSLSEPILGLYTDNASAPLDVRAGLQQVYKFGIYSHCAYVSKTAGSCTGVHTAYKFQPYTVITNDMLSNYSDYTDVIIRNATFADSSSLGKNSRAAYYLLLFGLVLSTISMLTSVRSRLN